MFSPSETNLATMRAVQNIDTTVTYTDELTGLTYPVSLSASESNPTISVSGARISGYYTDPFNYTVTYLNKDKQDVTVSKFTDIDKSNLYELHQYSANSTVQKVYTYTATAWTDETRQTPLATQSYTVTILNNWSYGKNQLTKYINEPTYYEKIAVSFKNNSGQTITTLDNSGNPIIWENNS